MLLTAESLLALLRESGGPMTTKEMMARLDLSTEERSDLRHLLKELSRRRQVQRIRGTFWQLAPERVRARELHGRLSVNRRGTAFVRLDPESIEMVGGTRDVMVSKDDVRDALDGDEVVVEVLRSGHKGLSGRVLEVTRRTRHRIVGMFQRTHKDRAEVLPRNSSIPRHIAVPLPDKKLAVENYDWVMVEITRFTPAPDPLVGTIIERLGSAHEQGIDVLLLLRDKGIVEEFSPALEEEAARLSVDWSEEISRRKDLRALDTSTIDPATAKDFDDALSIEALDAGGWRLWVHIADVSHFVRPGTILDDEAQERSTSVYPVDRVVPMLPEKLSNELCSLRPGEDKLVMTAEMEIRADGSPGKARFYSAVIKSNQRLTYEQVQAYFDEQPGAADAINAELRDKLLMLRDCARAMRKRRFERGALDLDIPELEIAFHEDGEVSHLHFAERFEAHKLVEDCMLAANEAVATHLTKKKAPLLYRIHEQADPDRLEQLMPVLKALQVPLKVSAKGGITHKDLQGVLRELEKRPAGHIIRRIVLRALKRAEYSPDNAGHFGLASPCYCHFTSPIRRYPDVVVHRQLRALEHAAPLPYPADESGHQRLEQLARHTSMREREADDAEWQSAAIKSIEYLKQFEGDEFDGLICGIQPFGMFVELQPHAVEGLVPVRTMRDDRYEADDYGIELVGQRSGRRFRLTDKVRVKLVRANPFEGEMDLELVEGGRGPSKTPRGQKKFYSGAPKGRGRKRR